MNTNELVATGIRIRLAHMNKTQVWLATQVGYSKQALTARMVGRVRFNMDDLDRFAKALGISQQQLTSGELIPTIPIHVAA